MNEQIWLRRAGSPTINNLSLCVQILQAALANVTSCLPDSLCAVQQPGHSRQQLINIHIVWTQNKVKITWGWLYYVGEDTGCSLHTSDFAGKMKSSHDGFQNPWNENNKKTVVAVGTWCLCTRLCLPCWDLRATRKSASLAPRHCRKVSETTVCAGWGAELHHQHLVS